METAANINLFEGVTPDIEGGEYFYPPRVRTTREAFYALIKDYLLETFSYDVAAGNTFKIYDNTITIAPSVFINTNPYFITYITVNDLFYFVQSVKKSSAGYVFSVTPDEWANYIYDAKISNCKFSRTNILIKQKWYENLYIADEYPRVEDIKKEYTAIDATKAITEMRIIAVVNITYTKPGGVAEHTSRIPYIFTAYTNQPEIWAIVGNSGTLKNRQDLFYALYDAVQGIYETADNQKAYIEKLYFVNTTGGNSNSVLYFNTYLYGQKIKLYAQSLGLVNEVKEYVYTFYNCPDILKNAINYYIPDGKGINKIGAPLYAGTKFDNIKIPSFVGAYQIKLTGEITADGLKITLSDGNNSKDITSCFAVPSVADTGNLTSLQTIAKAAGVISNVAGAAFQISAGGAGIVSGGAQLTQTIASLKESNGSSVIPNGSGWNTFFDIISTGEGNILFLSSPAKYDTMIDNAIKNGVQCQIYREGDINAAILPITYLLDNSSADKSPLIALNCIVRGVPYSARQLIQDTLRNGVRIKYLGSI